MTLDMLERLDDCLIDYTDVPDGGLLVLVSLPISEPRAPCAIKVNGREVLLAWPLDAPERVLTSAADHLRRAGWHVGIAGLDAGNARQTLFRAADQGWLVLYDAPLLPGRMIVTDVRV